jgi:hypothetical protein
VPSQLTSKKAFQMTKFYFALALLLNAFPSFAEETNIPSCYQLVKSREFPGTTKPCSLHHVKKDTASKIINKQLEMRQIKENWYFWINKKEIENWTTEKLWVNLVVASSSVQSLYNKNADLYFAYPPETDALKKSFVKNGISDSSIIGHAKFIAATEISKNNKYPKSHHENTYTLTVN